MTRPRLAPTSPCARRCPGRYSLAFHVFWGEVFGLRAVDLETEKGLALQVTLALPPEEIVVGGI